MEIKREPNPYLITEDQTKKIVEKQKEIEEHNDYLAFRGRMFAQYKKDEEFIRQMKMLKEQKLNEIRQREELSRILNNTGKNLLGSASAMSSLLDLDFNGMDVISKQLRGDDEFIKNAIQKNEQVFSKLDNAEKAKFTNSYLDSRRQNTQTISLGAYEQVHMSPYKLDKSIDKNVAYSPEKIENAYAKILKEGARDEHGVYKEEYAYLNEAIDAIGANRVRDYQKKAIERSSDNLIEQASNDFRWRNKDLDLKLKACEELTNPNIQKILRDCEEKQKELWKQHEDRAIELQKKDRTGQKLNDIEKKALGSARDNLGDEELEQKTRIMVLRQNEELREKLKRELEKKGVIKRQEVRRQEELAGIKESAMASVRVNEDRGKISTEIANDIVSRIDVMPSVAVYPANSEYGAFIESMRNNSDNLEMGEYGDGIGLSKYDKIKEENLREKDEAIERYLEALDRDPSDVQAINGLWAEVDYARYEQYAEKRDRHDEVYMSREEEKRERTLDGDNYN